MTIRSKDPLFKTMQRLSKKKHHEGTIKKTKQNAKIGMTLLRTAKAAHRFYNHGY